MSAFSVHLMDRSFSDYLTLPPIALVPERYSCAAIGGPSSATIQMSSGEPRAIWETLEWLRCPIEIINDQQRTVWWGYVSEVEIRVGALTVRVSLANMFNRVKVLYGEGESTAWFESADSIATYGTKELVLTLSDAGSDLADAYAAAQLAVSHYPVPEITFGDPQTGYSGTLICAGWFETLDWKYFAEDSAAAVDTATQISSIASDSGQFISSTYLKLSSGITSDPYRTGENTAKYEIEVLLEGGTSNGLRMLAAVNKARELSVWEEAEADVNNPDIFISGDGSVSTIFGSDASYISTCPAGIWARLKDVIPGSLDLSVIFDPSILFIEGAEYVAAAKRYYPTARLQSDPLGVGTEIVPG